MNLTPRDALSQFGHLLQESLFPRLESSVGTLSPQMQLLTAVLAIVPLAGLLHARRARTGDRRKIEPPWRLPFWPRRF